MLIRFANWLEEGVIAFLLAAMTLLTFTQVVLRFVFNTGLSWALEATTYLFAWLVLVGISYGIKVGAHIGVHALVDLLPPRGRQVAGLAAGLLCSVYAALLLIGSWEYFKTVHLIGVTGEDIMIQRWLMIVILPIGFAFLLMRVLITTWQVLRGQTYGFRLANEAADAMKYRDETGAENAPADPAKDEANGKGESRS